ncbi:MAG TPA: hypothetical protein VGR62_25100 [Candidatus Binatia bacterium]|jgi:hypothetical protein|nr:hypothetical protein [Candidatus Binatia bacterium]
MLSKETLDKLMDDLRRQRDELKLKVHLAKADARDEWVGLEKQWEHLRAKLAGAGSEASDVAENVGAALGSVAEELRRGYDRIRRHF